MNELVIPKEFNYIGVFLTLNCRMGCSYCLNKVGGFKKRDSLTPSQWVKGLSRIEAREDLPITLQGGEPTEYKGFYQVVKELDKPMDLLTNCMFDTGYWLKMVCRQKFMRAAPYASIRVSFHPERMSILKTIEKVAFLKSLGYQIGIWMVDHPDYNLVKKAMMSGCKEMGIDFRVKEFLGYYKGELYGTYKYEGSVDGKTPMACECRGTELLIGPEGNVYGCHSDLYSGNKPLGNIMESDFTVGYEFKACDRFGFCNYCDVKVKTNRHQVFGYTSVEIKEVI